MSTKIKTNQKIRIKLNSFDFRSLDESAKFIVETAQRSGAKVIGPVPMPVKKKRWCILKSPHVNKRGGEHYEIRIHSRIIDILDPPSTSVDALMQIDLPAGINIEIKLE